MNIKNRILKQKKLFLIVFIAFATLGKSFFEEGTYMYYVGAFILFLVSLLIYRLIFDKEKRDDGDKE